MATRRDCVDLLALLDRRAEDDPRLPLFTALSPALPSSPPCLDAGRLRIRARAIASRLQRIVAPGDRVLWPSPSTLEAISAFWGILCAGAIAVPVPMPRRRHNDRLEAIVRACTPAMMIGAEADLSRVEDESCLSRLARVDPADVADEEAEEWRAPRCAPTDVAFLQYTSGSTGDPKGVRVAHDNILANTRQMHEAFGLGPSTRCVSWLPLYHDMGLIGGMLQAMYSGYLVSFLAPSAFADRPLVWLEAITQQHATISGGPNFGFEAAARALDALPAPADLDLSSWQTAFNGSEPVRVPTLRRFARAAAPYGFRATALRPCYGLAEASLLVSLGRWSDGDAREPARVALGPPVTDLTLLIVDPESGVPVPDGVTGEVWIAGPNVARGYWNHADATREAFGARCRERPGQAFLRTGDIGLLDQGQLSIVDRLKDVIIVRGTNHHAPDLEAVVEESHPAVRTHACAAFGAVRDGEEQVVIVCEIVRGRDTDAEAIVSAIRRTLAGRFALQPADVVLLRAGALPRTSSGKVQRGACRVAYLTGRLPIVRLPSTPGRTAAPGHEVQRLLAEAIGCAPADIPLDEDIGSLGIDSLRIAQVRLAITRLTGLEIAHSILLGMTVERLVALTSSAGLRSAPPPESSTGEESASLVAPLSAGQRGLLFMDDLHPERNAFSIARVLRIRGPLDVEAFDLAVRTVFARHQALRMRVTVVDDQPMQRFDAPVYCQRHDAAGWDERRLFDETTRRAGTPFDVRQDPLVTVDLYTRSAEEAVLVFRAHHLAVDLWSLALLLHELEQGYLQAHATGTCAPTAPAPRFTDFVSWQRVRIDEVEGEQLSRFWHERLEHDLHPLELPFLAPDRRVDDGAAAAAGVIDFAIERSHVDALRALARANAATLNAVVVAIFGLVLGRYSGQERLVLGTFASGRSHPAFEGLLGYCANLLPLRVRLDGRGSVDELVRALQQELATALDHQDLPFSRIVERLRTERRLDGTAFIRAVCVSQPASLTPDRDLGPFVLNRSGGSCAFGDLRLESMRTQSAGAQFDLCLSVTDAQGGLAAALQFDAARFDEADMAALAESFQTALASVAGHPGQAIADVPLISQEAYLARTSAWNVTSRPIDATPVHEAILARARAAPLASAVTHRELTWTYGELLRRAEACATRLRHAGIGPEQRVALCVERSAEMVAALIGILQAGAVYVPLDPAHPADRQELIVREASPVAVIVSRGTAAGFLGRTYRLLSIEQLCEPLAADAAQQAAVTPAPLISPEQAAYVMYTSGSTGTPKGVVVTHRNVMNLFRGLDDAVGCDERDTLIAVTSVAFDISILELLWTLACGAHIVVADDLRAAASARPARARPLDVSLFYFADTGQRDRGSKYDLLLDGARYADSHGFTAVWTPERHFHSFGGLYPNPSLTSAALSTITSRVRLRAGSVVLPLQHPVRVAEEWSVVDNLSGGRVDVAFASGWHAGDFAFSPETYADRKAVMFDRLATVRALWRGETVTMRGGDGRECAIQLYPKPIQPELPIWLTAAGSPDTFRAAARVSANVLTHLLGQDLTALGEKIATYRSALDETGRDRTAFTVTLMLHAYVDETHDRVVAQALGPLRQYLRSSLDLVGQLLKGLKLDLDIERMSEPDIDDLVAFAAERYMRSSGLLGTPDECLDVCDRLVAAGVDELACLVDFGVVPEAAMRSLARVAEIRDRFNRPAEETVDYSVPALAHRSGATMIQCTPSLMALLLGHAGMRERLAAMRVVLLGGEAVPAGLVRELGPAVRAMNMYGPTETTVWSAATALDAQGDRVRIGGALANQQLYILDAQARPLPIGMTGELWIGGAGLARGYAGAPAATAARFIPDAYGATPGARLYRTGDLGRQRQDGGIELLGRVDQQVKIRGHRVELGEIETACNRLPGVQAAIVLLQRDAARGDQLVAYIQSAQAQVVEADAIRTQLRGTLPAYMVPSTIVSVDRFPFTANGKIDRRALSQTLPPPPRPRAVAASAGESEMEQQVRRIWQELLATEEIGVEDNFFDRGGHSLLMALVHQRLQAVMDRTFPLIAVLQHPTIRGMAAHLAGVRAPEADDRVRTRARDQREALLAHRAAAAQQRAGAPAR